MADYLLPPASAAAMGHTLLRLAPALISSASFMCAWNQQMAFRSFIAPAMLAKPNHMSAHVACDWFGEYARPIKWVINLAYPGGLILGFWNAAVNVDQLPPLARLLYAAGAVLSISHFWFASWSFQANARIARKTNIGKPNEDGLRAWLSNNGARMTWVNFPAWVCFFVATVLAVSVSA